MTARLEERPSAEIARAVMAITDAGERRIVRLGYRERIAGNRLQTRQVQGFAKPADAFAKFGGGSLLTTTLLLMINGKVPFSVVVTAVLALLLFLGCTILWMVLEHRVAKREAMIERLDAVLKETER